MNLTQGWISPNDSINKTEPNCIQLKQSTFLGVHKATDRAYLFTNKDNNTGTWIPKSMCYGIFYHPDLTVTVTHPAYAECKQTTLRDTVNGYQNP